MGKRKTKEEFVKDAVFIHNYKYDYSRVEYITCKNKVCIICPEHGEFWQTPDKHINSKQGCPKCAGLVPSHPDLSHIIPPPGSKAVPVGTKGKYALVDDEDYDRVMEYSWYLDKGGYASNNTVGFMHRFIMNPPDDMVVDHKFHKVLDNRKSQLRICTNEENIRNQRHRVGGTSKYKGVYYDKTRGKWAACVSDKSKTISLGRFDDEIEAAKAYDKAAKERYRSFYLPNFTDT